MNIRLGFLNIELSSLGAFLGVLIYGLLLDVIYVKFLSSIFGYAGFLDNSTWQLFVFSLFLLIGSFYFIAPIISEDENRISSLIITLLYLLSYVPFTTCVFAGMYSYEFIALHIAYWLWLISLQRYFLRNFDGFNSRFGLTERFKRRIFYFIVIFSALTILYVSFRYTGFRMHFSLLDVYDLRLEAKGYGLPTLLTYFLSWTSTVNPFVVGYAFMKRNYFLMAFVLFMQFINFGIAGHKSVLLMPYFVMFMLWQFKNLSLHSVKEKVVWLFNIVCILSVIECYFSDTFYVLAMFVRRMFFLPALLDKAYFEFFSVNSPDYFFSSFLRHFGFETQYKEGIAYTIGTYLGAPNMGANNGLFSDAFSNLGYLGIIVLPILIVLMLRITDGIMTKFPVAFHLILALPVAGGLLSTALFTVLNTHGWLAGLVLASVLDFNESR